MTERSGSKAGAGGGEAESYRYFANIALGLCEGPVAAIRRVWADGREIDLTAVEMRLHRGSENQSPDPLIEARQGQGNTPAYRGLAYVVFEHLPLDGFGNRIPVFQFEVLRPTGTLERRIRAVTIIPGATEHGYATEKTKEKTGEGSARIVNRNQLRAGTDWQASIDELCALCPNLDAVALVVSWFGTDLRAGHCRILPGVETAHRDGEDPAWSVSGIARGDAHIVSLHDGGPAYGGTPDDRSVLQAIRDLRSRGLKVFLYPFLMMDVPHGNGLPDPYGGDEQAPYPWRGRITCHPGPAMADTADRTASAAAQIAAFAGSAKPGDFDIDGEQVRYGGSDEGYRRLVLHYAQIARVAGGVDGLIIGSELRGLTTLRNGSGDFPFVDALIGLAEDVAEILPGTDLTYGADWSEYFGHHPDDGSGDVYYHLDPLWASPAISAVGIDNYIPLMDFRDDDLSGNNPDGARCASDIDAMRRAIRSGEGFDWYYASEADRNARLRSPITDGLAGKPWVYRYKDIENWWKNAHRDRVGGQELAKSSKWQPKMKKIWFTELGCPAIDRGANQPNVFVDPKSSESFVPYFSAGSRSDTTQRRFLDAHLGYWGSDEAPAGMVDERRIFVWTWDARAYPAFPEEPALYADGENWWTGHWLNGRLGASSLADTIAAICEDAGFSNYDVSAVEGDLTGYVAGGNDSARDLIDPLMATFGIDVNESGGRLVFRSRNRACLPATLVDVVAEDGTKPLWQETIGQDGDHAGQSVLDYSSAEDGYAEKSMRSRKIGLAPERIVRASLPATLHEQAAGEAVELLLKDNRLSRRQISFAVGPHDIALEPGDIIGLADGPEGRFMIGRIEEGAMRRIEAREVVAQSGRTVTRAKRMRKAARNPSALYAPRVAILDLPVLAGSVPEDCAKIALGARPWRRAVISFSDENENFGARGLVTRSATMGSLTRPLDAGGWQMPMIDTKNRVKVSLGFGELQSVSMFRMMNGANRAAIKSANGGWEIVGFASAEEMTPGVYELSTLLRGLYGTEAEMAAGAAEGAPFVFLDGGVFPLGLESGEVGKARNLLIEATGSGGGKFGPIPFDGAFRAYTPLAPVHLKAIRSGADILLTWTRRGRIDADGWDGDDIPLGEDKEAYRVEILKAGGVARAFNTSVPRLLYPANLELADFGAVQTMLSFRVRQRGTRIGLGLAAATTVDLAG